MALAEFVEKSSTAAVAENWAEKRKHKRYRLMEKLLVRTKDGVACIGTALRPAKGALSGVFVNANLPVGVQLELVLVLGCFLLATEQKNFR